MYYYGPLYCCMYSRDSAIAHSFVGKRCMLRFIPEFCGELGLPLEASAMAQLDFSRKAMTSQPGTFFGAALEKLYWQLGVTRMYFVFLHSMVLLQHTCLLFICTAGQCLGLLMWRYSCNVIYDKVFPARFLHYVAFVSVRSRASACHDGLSIFYLASCVSYHTSYCSYDRTS